jgi:hypothetical protein
MLQGERKNGDVVRKTAGYARRTNERAQRKRLNIVRLKDALTEAVDRLLKTAQRYRQVKTMAGILT